MYERDAVRTAREGLRSFLGTVVDAVRGRGEAPTEGPLLRAILLLAVPMVLEMVMESVFAVVDISFVSRLGAEAMAAVGLTESLMAVVYTVAVGLSIGVTAVVARRVGERDADAAAVSAVQAILLGVVLSAVLGVVGVLNAPRFPRWMGAGPDVLDVGAGYTAVMLGANGARGAPVPHQRGVQGRRGRGGGHAGALAGERPEHRSGTSASSPPSDRRRWRATRWRSASSSSPSCRRGGWPTPPRPWWVRGWGPEIRTGPSGPSGWPA